MGPSQSRLADSLNALVDGGRVVVTETASGLSVYQLNGVEAASLLELMMEAGWSELEFRDAGGPIEPHQLADNGEGITAVAKRPTVPAGIEAVLTKSGFQALLERPAASQTVWVQGLSTTIDTRSVRYCPWWQQDPFHAQDGVHSVARITRVLGKKGPSKDLGRWVLKAAEANVADDALKPWRRRAAANLLRAMAQEIEVDERLFFRGPPATRFSVDPEVDLPPDLFASMQSVSAWLLESEREVENRHGLLAAEIARTSFRDGNAVDMSGVLPAAFEGARIAYAFGVAQQSRDTLKALGDLRKTVSDDTAKMSETTRALGTAIVGAVFTNIALIVARLTLPANSTFVAPAAVLLGVVVAIYVATIIGSGFHYMWMQKLLRQEWRSSLYRFLSDPDYQRLVEKPVQRAEGAFWWMSIAGGAMAVLVLAATVHIIQSP